MEVYPTQEKVLVKQDEKKDKSEGGIILANVSKEKPLSGEIVRVGPDVTGIQAGMKILFAAYAGTKIGKEYLIMEESDVIAVTGDK